MKILHISNRTKQIISFRYLVYRVILFENLPLKFSNISFAIKKKKNINFNLASFQYPTTILDDINTKIKF